MISTKDIKGNSEGGLPKNLQPGNHTCTVNGIRLEEFKFKEGAYHIILSLEGPDMGSGFEGFFIDKNNESKGRHKGQVGEVKASEWAYADGQTKSGIVVKRDDEILKFLKNFCNSFGINEWLIDQDGKHATIESLISALNKEKPFTGVAVDFCVGGKEYTNKNGYTAYDLFLPKFSKSGAAFGKSKVASFNEAEHIRRKKVETVSEFGNDSNSGSADFEL
jgi:hypothetical protein